MHTSRLDLRILTYVSLRLHAQLIKEVEEVKADVEHNMIKMGDKLDAGLELVEKIVATGEPDAASNPSAEAPVRSSDNFRTVFTLLLVPAFRLATVLSFLWCLLYIKYLA